MGMYENSYKIKLQSMDEILHQISCMDQAEDMEKLNEIIPELLKAIGRYTGADRVYIFDWSSEEHTGFDNTFEWCAEGVVPEINTLQNIPLDVMPTWMESFNKQETIVIPDVESVSKKSPQEYAILKRQNIKSVIAVPVYTNHTMNGFIGLDNPDISQDKLSIKLLSDVGGHLGSVRENQKMIKKLQDALTAQIINNEIISAISKIYWLIYRMDLLTDTFEEISSGDNMHLVTGKNGKTSVKFDRARRMVVAREHQEVVKQFLDMSTLAERLKNTETICQEYRTVSGNWHIARFIVKKRNEKGEAIHVLYVVRVINDQKLRELEYQDKLRESVEEAKRANSAKTDFLRHMSHDIRTPINAIKGFIEIGNYYADDLERQTECRQKIENATAYLLELVSNILDMSKLESGQTMLENKAFNLEEMLKDTEEIVEIQAREKGVTILPERKEIIHAHVKGSQTHLKQIILNIMTNAVKYNKTGGSVLIKCREYNSDKEKAFFEWECQDTGIGISPEFQKHMYEPFTQENSEVRTTYTGTGLGLSITKKLVEKIGGTISVESDTGIGSRFIIRFPLAIDSERYRLSEEQDSALLKGKKILLVEDNEMNMEIAEFLFQTYGMVVTKAWNGQEAVEIFADSQPGEYSMIFMDVMMPVLDGIEATKHIRYMKRSDAKIVPIFAMTANAFQEDVELSRNAGMNEYFTKPLEMKKIIDTILKYFI